MSEKIVCVIIGQDCRNYIDMCIESVSDADAIVYLDGGSEDLTIEYLFDRNFRDDLNEGDENKNIIYNEFDPSDSLMISKQRNFYLEYLKKNYKDYWCLVIDADEVLDSLEPFRKLLNDNEWNGNEIFNPRMRHLINNLITEDATKPTHFVPRRFFKITDDKFYPNGEHTILKSKNEIKNLNFQQGLIWHLGYLGGSWDIKKRFDDQILRKESNEHPVEYLNQWKNVHVFGQYPVRQFNPIELPEIILGKFGVEKDMLYFAQRKLEIKHPEMVKQWNDYFKPTGILDLGCGRGCYLKYWKWFVKDYTYGIELSNFAVNNAYCKNVINGNISDESIYEKTDLITAIDVLEHLTNDDLDKTLKNMTKYGKQFLFSIPFIGDPNLEADSTHIQKKTKEEWINLIESYGIKIKETPNDWLFQEQILIFKKEVN